MAGLLFRISDINNPASMASRLRMERFRLFAAMLEAASRPKRILDVGGTPDFWITHRPELRCDAEVVLLNVEFAQQPTLPGISYVVGDGRNMHMFGNRQFDVCFSNSVIEHVGTLADQLHMAREIQRVGRGYFVQTPNLYFPIEPHFLVVGWQFMPMAIRAQLVRRRAWPWMGRQGDPLLARATVESIRLVSEGELRRLFPDGRIYREKIGPLTKSFVAWRAIDCSDSGN